MSGEVRWVSPQVLPVGAGERDDEQPIRALRFRDLARGRRRVSLCLQDLQADYDDPAFADYRARANAGASQYVVPVSVAETVESGRVEIRDYLETVLVPAVPVRFLKRSAEDAGAHATAPLRPGWLYVFLHGRLWREIEVEHHLGSPFFRDVNLTLHQGRDERPAHCRLDNRLLLPYRGGLDAGIDAPLQMAYSEVQWSWAYCLRMGGLADDDPRRIEALHGGEHWGRAITAKPDAGLRARRLQAVDLDPRRRPSGDRHEVWQTFRQSLEGALDSGNHDDLELERESVATVIALHDPMGLARDCAAAYQTAWRGMHALIQAANGTLEWGGADAAPAPGERASHAGFIEDMRRREAEFQCALTLQQRFLGRHRPAVTERSYPEIRQDQERAREHWEKFRLNLDPRRIREVLRADERGRQRELIAETKRDLVALFDDLERPWNLTVALEDYFTLEPQRRIGALEVLDDLTRHLALNPSHLDAALEAEPPDQARELAADPGLDLALRLTASHPDKPPHPLAAWVFPRGLGDDPDDLHAYDTTPVGAGEPVFDANVWMQVATLGKAAGATLAGFLQELGQLQHLAAMGGIGAPHSWVPLARLALVTETVGFTVLDVPLADYADGNLPAGAALFRADHTHARAWAAANDARNHAADTGPRMPMYDFGDGPFERGLTQGEARVSELRRFDGTWHERAAAQAERALANGRTAEIRVRAFVATAVLAHPAGTDAEGRRRLFIQHREALQAEVDARRVHPPQPHSETPNWINARAFPAALARYGILGFASVFEGWNLRRAWRGYRENHDNENLFGRGLQGFVAAAIDVGALATAWAESARLTAVGLDQGLARQVTAKVQAHRRSAAARQGRLPALTAAERRTWTTLNFSRWALRFGIASATGSGYFSVRNALSDAADGDYDAALAAGVQTGGAILFGISQAAQLSLLGTAGAAAATWVTPVGWVGLAALLLGTWAHVSFKDEAHETWLRHSGFQWENPDDLWTQSHPMEGRHAYWRERPGLMFRELMQHLIRPSVVFTTRFSPSAPEQWAVVSLPYFGPESMLEMDLAFGSESEVWEKTGIISPEDLTHWHPRLLPNTRCQLERNVHGQIRALSFCFDLTEFPGGYRITLAVRLHPFGPEHRVVGEAIVLPEPERTAEGEPKEGADEWIRAETRGIAVPRGQYVAPPGSTTTRAFRRPIRW